MAIQRNFEDAWESSVAFVETMRTLEEQGHDLTKYFIHTMMQDIDDIWTLPTEKWTGHNIREIHQPAIDRMAEKNLQELKSALIPGHL